MKSTTDTPTSATDNSLSLEQRGQLLKSASYASVLTAGTLIVLKLFAWIMTGSVGLLASLVDSLMDSLASIVNMVAVRYSLLPPDKHHRFGHGKAEPLAGLVQAGFICGSALFLILHAVERLRFPNTLRDIDIAIAVMLIATALTAVLLLYQRMVIKKTGSTAIKADALHYFTDLLTNLSIIAALLLSRFGWGQADAIMAIVISIYITYSAYQIGQEAFQQLMDRELPDDMKATILGLATGHPGVLGVHDLKTRQAGQAIFIQLHLELQDSLSLLQSHRIADEVEALICNAFDGAEVIVHQDPSSVTATETISFNDEY